MSILSEKWLAIAGIPLNEDPTYQTLSVKVNGKSHEVTVNVVNPYSSGGAKDKKPTVTVPGFGMLDPSELESVINVLTKALKEVRK